MSIPETTSRHPSETSTFVRLAVHVEVNDSRHLCHACGKDLCCTYWDPYRREVRRFIDHAYASRDGHVVICWVCVEEIVNLYSHAHSGQWSSWPNPPAKPDPRKKWKISPGLRREVYERDAYRCRYCAISKDLGIDHVIPITDPRSTNDLENLVTCCRSCNSRKGSRTPEEAGMTMLPEEAIMSHGPESR